MKKRADLSKSIRIVRKLVQNFNVVNRVDTWLHSDRATHVWRKAEENQSIHKNNRWDQQSGHPALGKRRTGLRNSRIGILRISRIGIWWTPDRFLPGMFVCHSRKKDVIGVGLRRQLAEEVRCSLLVNRFDSTKLGASKFNLQQKHLCEFAPEI